MNVYAEVGASLQQIGGDLPDGWIVMQSERPSFAHVAMSDGTWGIAARPVPQIVSRFQGREAMWQTKHGSISLFEAAEDIINDPATPPMYARAWADLQEFRRDSEMLAAIAAQLGLTDADIDDLFVLAASIAA